MKQRKKFFRVSCFSFQTKLHNLRHDESIKKLRRFHVTFVDLVPRMKIKFPFKNTIMRNRISINVLHVVECFELFHFARKIVYFSLTRAK